MKIQALLWRTVESQAAWTFQNILEGDVSDIELLEDLVEETKPDKAVAKAMALDGYHPLIFTPFRYPTPVPPAHAARFRPPNSEKNVFYGGFELGVTLYENAFYFMSERRINANPTSTAEQRTAFSVKYHDDTALDLSIEPNIVEIMDRHSYSASHAYIETHPCDSLVYPSARHPSGRCAAVFEINCLAKNPAQREELRFIYDKSKDRCLIYQEKTLLLTVDWIEVT